MSSQETLISKKRGPKPKGAVGLMVRTGPELLAAMDAWIAERRDHFHEELSRPEAMRRLAAEALAAMGLLKLGG